MVPDQEANGANLFDLLLHNSMLSVLIRITMR